MGLCPLHPRSSRDCSLGFPADLLAPQAGREPFPDALSLLVWSGSPDGGR